MIDYASIATLGVTATIVVAVIIYRARQKIPPGKEGIVVHEGRYRRTLNSGIHWIPPLDRVTLVPAGTSVRFFLGHEGVLVRAIPPGGVPGIVRIGSIEVPAYASWRNAKKGIANGTQVRINFVRIPAGSLPDGAVVERNDPHPR